jgi:sugar phosphate isomerase/epimerase
MLRLGIEAGANTLNFAVEHHIRGVPISADHLSAEGVSAFSFNPLSVDELQQAHQKNILTKVIPLAAETGCPYIVINGGNLHPSGFSAGDARNFTDEALDRLADELFPFVTLAERYGAFLSIEPYIKTVINAPERFLSLKKKLASNALRINIDVTSLYSYHEMWFPEKTVESICMLLIGHYGLVHIKDIALQEGFHIHIDLAPLGSSPTNWSQFLRLAAPHVPADSWVILEHVQTPDEAQRSLALLRNAAEAAQVELT